MTLFLVGSLLLVLTILVMLCWPLMAARHRREAWRLLVLTLFACALGCTLYSTLGVPSITAML
jgi:hypothetical protein